MKQHGKRLEDWKKEWQNQTDLKALTTTLDHIDELYEKVRDSIGRILMSAEMIEIQEIIEKRVDELSAKNESDKVAA